MKIPEWLPDTKRPTRPDCGSTEPVIDRLSEPFARFFRIEAAGGIVLLSCALIALGIANSPWAVAFAQLWQTKVGVTVGGFAFQLSLQHWINDGAMTIFFFVVGLEIKREMVHGRLREVRNAVLPVVAALGGIRGWPCRRGPSLSGRGSPRLSWRPLQIFLLRSCSLERRRLR